MEAIVLKSDSKADLKLIADLAKKIGVSVRYLTEEEKEDVGLSNAIKKGRTGKYVDANAFIEKLRA